MNYIELADDEQLFSKGLRITPQQIKIADRYAKIMNLGDGTFEHHFLVGAVAYLEAAYATGELSIAEGARLINYARLRAALVRVQSPLVKVLTAMGKVYTGQGGGGEGQGSDKLELFSSVELSAPKKKPATKKAPAKTKKPTAKRTAEKSERIKKKKERIKSLQERINSHEGAPAKLSEMRKQLRTAVQQLQTMQRAEQASINMSELVR